MPRQRFAPGPARARPCAPPAGRADGRGVVRALRMVRRVPGGLSQADQYRRHRSDEPGIPSRVDDPVPRGRRKLMNLEFSIGVRLTHFFNFLLLSLLVRSGIEILGAHPKLYWRDHCSPGSEWIRFTRKKMPDDALWTAE